MVTKQKQGIQICISCYDLESKLDYYVDCWIHLIVENIGFNEAYINQLDLFAYLYIITS